MARGKQDDPFPQRNIIKAPPRKQTGVELQSMDPKSVPLSSMSDVRIGSQTELHSETKRKRPSDIEEDERDLEIPHIDITYQAESSKGE